MNQEQHAAEEHELVYEISWDQRSLVSGAASYGSQRQGDKLKSIIPFPAVTAWVRRQ